MPGVYDSTSSLPSPDQHHTETSAHPKEIIIRIYASDEQGRFFATAPVPPPTPPETTGSSGSEQEKQQKKASPPLRRKLSKPARLRGKAAESPKATPGTTISRSISNPVKQVHHSKSAESFRQAARQASKTGPHRASQPPQHVQRPDSRSHGILKTGIEPQPNHAQQAEYDLAVFSGGDKDAPVFGSCDKRLRGNRSYESKTIPPSDRGRRATALDRPAVDESQSSSSTPPAADLPPVPVKTVHGQVEGVPELWPSLSLEQFRKDIGWPSSTVDCTDTDEPLLPATRYSGRSPMPTDMAPSETRGLRHTERQSSLPLASSPTPNSDPASRTGGFDSPHRLLHKAGRISEQDRQNTAPEVDMFAEPTSQAPKRRVDVVPVVVIPERQSSLSYPATQAAAGNHVPPRPSQQSNGRPSTAAGDWARSSAPYQQEPMSNHVAGFPRGIASRSQSARRPTVPARRSSLSAPTSVNNSRATSLTSDSLRSHTLAMRETEFKRHLAEKPMPRLPSEPLRPSMYGLTDDDTQTQSILIGIEDVDHIGTPPAPFSHGSAPSSPGVFEVNEATAVNLYPHNNESLLLVDRQPSTRNKKQETQGQPPTRQVEFATTNDGGSPRHPRPPPNTPICHVTPPSPMRELEPASNSKVQEPMLRRLGSLRRAWSTRTRTQPTNVPKRSFSTSATDNRKDTTSRVPENRLHPFWRPRRVRNDFPQPAAAKHRGPEKSPMHPPTSNTKQNDNVVKNSLGMPQPRAVMDGPSLPARTRSRRETNQRPRPQPPPPRKARPTTIYNAHLNRSTIALGNSTTHRVLHGPEFLDRASRASRHLRQYQQHPVTWGYRVRFGTVRNLRRRVRGRLQQHQEGKQEVNHREKLKRHITGMAQVDAVHGVTNGGGGGGGRRRRERLTKRR